MNGLGRVQVDHKADLRTAFNAITCLLHLPYIVVNIAYQQIERLCGHGMLQELSEPDCYGFR